MKMKRGWMGAAAGLALCAMPMAAQAQEARVEIEEEEELLRVQAGAGLHGFLGSGLGNYTDVGGGWEVRATPLPDAPVTMELGYVGALNPVAAPGLGNVDAMVASNVGEALVRMNLASIIGERQLGNVEVEPYIAVGASYTNMQLTGEDVNLPEVAEVLDQNGNAFGIPAAIGIDADVTEDVSLGARLAYDYAFDNDLTVAAADDAQSWRATAGLGVTF